MAKESPSERALLYVAQAVADMQRLLLLDAAWTDAGRRSDTLDDRDREALVALGEQVDTQLAAVDRHVDVLRRFLQSHSTWLNKRVATAVADERFTSQRDVIGRFLSVQNDGYAERGIQFLDTLESLMPAERGELRGKLRGIREAGPVVTDLSKGA